MSEIKIISFQNSLHNFLQINALSLCDIKNNYINFIALIVIISCLNFEKLFYYARLGKTRLNFLRSLRKLTMSIIPN